MDASYTSWISISGYIWTLNAVTFGILATLALLTLRDTDEDTWLVRAYQGWRLKGTRMSRLLKRRHVGVGDYVRSLPVAEVKAQIARCHDCQCKELCDRALRSIAPCTSRYSFCPNTDSVDRFAKACC